MSLRARLIVAAVMAVTAASVLSGCETSSGNPNPSPSTSVPIETPSPTSSASPTPVAAVVPKSCGELISTGVIDRAVGRHLTGDATYLRAKPLPSIGRTGRVTCGFGTGPGSGGTKADPVVKLSYITYDLPATAEQRLQATLADARKGADVTTVPVAGGTGYVANHPPTATLFMADGVRTFVVTVKLSVVPAAKAPAVLAAITAPLVAFGGGASASSSPTDAGA